MLGEVANRVEVRVRPTVQGRPLPLRQRSRDPPVAGGVRRLHVKVLHERLMGEPIGALPVLPVEHHVRRRREQQVVEVDLAGWARRERSSRCGPDAVGPRQAPAAGMGKGFQQRTEVAIGNCQPVHRGREQAAVVLFQQLCELGLRVSGQQLGPGEDLVHSQPGVEEMPVVRPDAPGRRGRGSGVDRQRGQPMLDVPRHRFGIEFHRHGGGRCERVEQVGVVRFQQVRPFVGRTAGADDDPAAGDLGQLPQYGGHLQRILGLVQRVDHDRAVLDHPPQTFERGGGVRLPLEVGRQPVDHLGGRQTGEQDRGVEDVVRRLLRRGQPLDAARADQQLAQRRVAVYDEVPQDGGLARAGRPGDGEQSGVGRVQPLGDLPMLPAAPLEVPGRLTELRPLRLGHEELALVLRQPGKERLQLEIDVLGGGDAGAEWPRRRGQRPGLAEPDPDRQAERQPVLQPADQVVHPDHLVVGREGLQRLVQSLRHRLEEARSGAAATEQREAPSRIRRGQDLRREQLDEPFGTAGLDDDQRPRPVVVAPVGPFVGQVLRQFLRVVAGALLALRAVVRRQPGILRVRLAMAHPDQDRTPRPVPIRPGAQLLLHPGCVRPAVGPRVHDPAVRRE